MIHVPALDNHTNFKELLLRYDLCGTFFQRMLHSGTTVVECKSGYGLELESEIKMLRVIERGKRELDMEISSTYCGAHSVPK